MDDPYADEYSWLEREQDLATVADERHAEGRALRSLGWDPLRDGWAVAPSREWLLRWFRYFPDWQGYELQPNPVGAVEGCSVRQYRRSQSWQARYSTLEAALIAIDTGNIRLRLELEYDAAEISVRALQGGAPGQSRRGRGRRR